jgi:hypothetical protein
MSSKKPTLADLSRESIDSFDAMFEFSFEMSTATDRACALIGAAALDRSLVDLLSTQFPNITDTTRERMFFSQKAVLSTFSSKIEVAHALGLIEGQDHREMTSIRRIRNAFAHSAISLKFDHPLIAAECTKLTMMPREELVDAARGIEMVPARQRYIGSIQVLTLKLYEHLTDMSRINNGTCQLKQQTTFPNGTRQFQPTPTL